VRDVFIAAILAAAMPAVLPAQLPGGRAVDVDLQRAQFNAVMIKVIREAAGRWQESWDAPNSNRLADQYADEAALVQPGGELVTGSAAIRAAVDSLRARVGEARLGFTDYASSEGIAYFYGPFEMEPRGGTLATIHGHHLTVLKRDRAGYRVRMQLFHPAPGTANLATQPELHPSGPLTRDVMNKPASFARYRSANALINQLHLAWERPDTAALLDLFTPDALIQMPGQAVGVKGPQAHKDVLEFRARSSALHMVPLDYHNAGRISSMLGQYLVELPSGSTFQGYFAVILAGNDDAWRIRALILL
jgi:ketosteroid isomerase-like protein